MNAEKLTEVLTEFLHYVNDELDLDIDPAEIESVVDEWIDFGAEEAFENADSTEEFLD